MLTMTNKQTKQKQKTYTTLKSEFIELTIQGQFSFNTVCTLAMT